MKNSRFILYIFFFIFVFASCTTDVDLYAEYKDVPIIYAMLDSRADTNYVKITRAFCGNNDDPINANEVALVYDSCNYPGKLDARIIELKGNGNTYQPTGREFVLDTITIHDKEEGAFYSPDQLLYYTSERLKAGSSESRYKYKLIVVKPDGDSVTAQTKMVGSEEFRILTSQVNFQQEDSDALGQIVFKADGIAPLYDVRMQFNYRERHGSLEAKKQVSRSFGTKPIEEYYHTEGSHNVYYSEYSVNWLFNALAIAIGGDTIFNTNHPNVVRYIDNFVISISAGGDDLYYYYMSTQAQLESPITLISGYTNISGGYGLFSSRTTIEKVSDFSSSTLRDLYGMASWGFKEQ